MTRSQIRYLGGVKIYNSIFSFTSIGGKIDHSINRERGPYVYQQSDLNIHKFGKQLSNKGLQPKFYQLYIYDTENEVGNRMRTINFQDTNLVDPEILEHLL